MSRTIAIISEQASPLDTRAEGGPTSEAASLACLLRQVSLAGYAVDLFTRRTAPDQPEVVEWGEGVRVVHVAAGPPVALPVGARLPHLPAFTAAVGRWCRARRYPLLHAISWLSGRVAADLKRQWALPFVVTFHGLGQGRPGHGRAGEADPIDRVRVEERLVAEADAIIATCPRDQEALLCRHGAEGSAITVIPDGFDPDEFWPMSRPLARAALGLPRGERLLLHVGSLAPRAGAETAVRALGRLVAHHGLPARLLLVGEGMAPGPDGRPGDLQRLCAVAAEEGVAEALLPLGWCPRDRLRLVYGAADLLIATPRDHARGRAVVEAMACGRPVVGSDVGAIAYAVRDGETGYLVAPDQPARVAERLAHLYAHPGLMEVVSRQAVRRAQAVFAWPRVIWAVTDLYDQVLAGRTGEAAFLSRQRVVEQGFDQAAAVLQGARRRLRRSLVTTAEAIAACFARGNALLIVGDAGSAGIAHHLAAEFVARAQASGQAPPRVTALAAEPGPRAATPDARGPADPLARQVAERGRAGDILLLIGAGDRARALVPAAVAARQLSLHVIALLGDGDETLRSRVDVPLYVAAGDAARVREAHLVIAHLLGELLELEFRERGQGRRAASAPRAGEAGDLTRSAVPLGGRHPRPLVEPSPEGQARPYEAGP